MADMLPGTGEPAAGATLPMEAPRETLGAVTSAWVPLRQELFRILWIASVASNVGTWMHEVGASWLMTQLAPSPLMVSLIQTAEALPVFLLALAAGALADVVDRRRLLIFSQSWMLGAALGLGILTVLHLTTPQLLLAFTFLLSFGGGFAQLRRLQRGACCRSGARRISGGRRGFRSCLSAQCGLVSGGHRGPLPVASRAALERPAGGARDGSYPGRGALCGPCPVHALGAGARLVVHVWGQRVVGTGAAFCPCNPRARSRRLRRAAGILRHRCRDRRIDSAAPTAGTRPPAVAGRRRPRVCGGAGADGDVATFSRRLRGDVRRRLCLDHRAFHFQHQRSAHYARLGKRSCPGRLSAHLLRWDGGVQRSVGIGGAPSGHSARATGGSSFTGGGPCGGRALPGELRRGHRSRSFRAAGARDGQRAAGGAWAAAGDGGVSDRSSACGGIHSGHDRTRACSPAGRRHALGSV